MKSKRDKILLVTNGNLASMLALKDWLSLDISRIQAVYVTKRLPSSRSNLSGIYFMFLNCGFRYTMFKIWLNIIAPTILMLKGRPHSVISLLDQYQFKGHVRKVVSMNDPTVISEIKNIEFDTLVSFSATHRFGNELLSLPKDGAINVHYGALPKFAGLSPYFWHLHEQDVEFGVTLHNISAQLDAGSIISQPKHKITHTDALGLLIDMAKNVSPLLIDYFASSVEKETPIKQNLQDRSYYGHPAHHQVKSFSQNGYSFSTKKSRRLFLEAAYSASN